MHRILFLLLSSAFLFFNSCTKQAENEGIKGLWYSTDQKSAEVRCLIAIYEYQNVYYGKILVTYDEDGNVNDTILKQKDRAPGIVGNPPYCGLDFIYNVKENGTNKYGNPKYKGKIVDPERGKEYKAELWLDGEDLIVRGELWIFGKNIRWFRAPKEALPKGFSLKDIKKFVPEVPQTK